MNKYFLIIVVTLLLNACYQPQKSVEEAAGTVKMDSLNKSLSNAPTELLKVSDLSVDELKDDTVFADGSKPTSWDIAGVSNVKGLKVFIKKLQEWIVLNQKDSLANVVKYPLGKIKNSEVLIKNYDSLFTKEVKLSFATLNFNQLFRNGKGVMINGGKVWFGQEGQKFKIIAINP